MASPRGLTAAHPCALPLRGRWRGPSCPSWQLVEPEVRIPIKPQIKKGILTDTLLYLWRPQGDYSGLLPYALRAGLKAVQICSRQICRTGVLKSLNTNY